MNKRERKRQENLQRQAEDEFMRGCAADLTRRWKCGIRRGPGSPYQENAVWASCDTEADAERYMLLRWQRNGGVLAHRMTDQVGWWDAQALDGT